MKRFPFVYSLLKRTTNKYDLQIFFQIHNQLRSHKAGLILVLLALVFLIPSNYLLYAQNSHQNLHLVYDKKLLSISADDADLRNVLLRLAEETGILVWFPSSLNKKISIKTQKIPLGEAVQKLLKDLNYAIIYSGPSGKEALISKVLVFKKSKKSAALRGKERRLANRIRTYKKRIEALQTQLSRIDANSNRAKKYFRQIKRYEKNIVNLENQLY
jgi:hypothetical protein